MTIIRNASRSKWVVVDKTTVEDKVLSAKALGWLCRVLAKPESWSVSIRQFAREYETGLEQVRTAFGELEAAGYVLRLRYQTERGTFEWEYQVFEAKEAAARARQEMGDLASKQRRSGGPRPQAEPDQPCSGNPNMDQPCSGSPYTDDPYTENPTTTKEGSTEYGLTNDGLQDGADAPGPPENLSLFQAQGSPDGSPGNGGSPSPHGAVPPPPPVSQNGHAGKKPDTAEVVRRVFEGWREATDHPGAKLTDARRRKATARLREGYTEEQLTTVVTEAWKLDPWPGRVDNNDLVILLRDGPQVEKFLDLARKARARNGNGSAVDPEEELRRAREHNARQRALQAAATSTGLAERLAREGAS